MAWNPSPEVAALREFAEKFECRIVVALVITADGRFGYHSFGETRSLCDVGKRIGDDLYESMKASIEKHYS